MRIHKDTTPVTDAITQIAMAGNIIPHSWYSAIRLSYGKKGQSKPDMYAINFLADVVYWYKNKQTRNESTGELIAISKKFRADKLQRSYADIGNFFGLSADVGKEVVDRLRKMGLIKTEVRKKVVDGDREFYNVLFIEPVPAAILAITHDVQILETQARKAPEKLSLIPAGTPAPAGETLPEGTPAPAGWGTPAPAPEGTPAPDIYKRFQVQEISCTSSPQTPKGAEGGKQQAQLPMDIDPKKKKTNTDEALIAECALKGVPAELLVDYLQYRRNIKHPIKTSQGLQAQINILAELGDIEAMQAALANTKDNEYRKIVPKAPVEPSTPSAAIVVTAASHGLTNGTVDAEMKLMIQHYKSKGFKVWDWDAAFARWLDNKARFEAGRVPAKTAVPRFSPSTDTSWIKELDPAELGFNCTAEEWRNA